MPGEMSEQQIILPSPTLMGLPFKLRNRVLIELLRSHRPLGSSDGQKVTINATNAKETSNDREAELGALVEQTGAEEDTNSDDDYLDDGAEANAAEQAFDHGFEPLEYHEWRAAAWERQQPVLREYIARTLQNVLTAPIHTQVSPQILCCNRQLFEEGRSILYYDNTVDIKCKVFGHRSGNILISIFSGTVVISGNPLELPDSESDWFLDPPDTVGRKCNRQGCWKTPQHFLHIFPSLKNFQRFHVTVEGPFMESMFVVCRALRNLFKNKDVVLEAVPCHDPHQRRWWKQELPQILSSTAILRCRSIVFKDFEACRTDGITNIITGANDKGFKDTFSIWKKTCELFAKMPAERGYDSFVDDYAAEEGGLHTLAITYDLGAKRSDYDYFEWLRNYLLLQACGWIHLKYQDEKLDIMTKIKGAGALHEDKSDETMLKDALSRRDNMMMELKIAMGSHITDDMVFEHVEKYLREKKDIFNDYYSDEDEFQKRRKKRATDAYDEFLSSFRSGLNIV